MVDSDPIVCFQEADTCPQVCAPPDTESEDEEPSVYKSKYPSFISSMKHLLISILSPRTGSALPCLPRN